METSPEKSKCCEKCIEYTQWGESVMGDGEFCKDVFCPCHQVENPDLKVTNFHCSEHGYIKPIRQAVPYLPEDPSPDDRAGGAGGSGGAEKGEWEKEIYKGSIVSDITLSGMEVTYDTEYLIGMIHAILKTSRQAWIDEIKDERFKPPKIYSVISVTENRNTGKTYRREVGEIVEQADGSKKLRLFMFPNLELWIREKTYMLNDEKG